MRRQTESTPNPGGTAQLVAENVCAFYGQRQILQDISLSLEPGKCLCLSGPNGCGKSTLMSVLCQNGAKSLRYSGNVTLDGTPIRNFKPKELARRITFMPQTEFSAWNYTVYDVILSGRFAWTNFTGAYGTEDKQIALETAEELGLSALLKRQIHSLSGGEFQRTRIARAFAQQTKVLVLDEPAAGLDFGVRFSLLKLIKDKAKRKKIAVLLSIHDVNLAAVFADTLALLSPISANLPHQLYAGTCEEILRTETLKAVYGHEFGVFTHPAYACPNVYVQK